MALSECYTVGYGVNHDMKSMLHWLYQAASAGSRKATAWYNRICITVGSSPLPLENAATYEDYGDSLSGIPAEDYLHARIQQLELARRTEARMKFEELFSGDICLEQRSVELATFHHLQIDVLNPVHVAAWLGLDSVIDKLAAASSQVNLISKLGRTPVFYACLGGHLSTLRSLIRSGGNVDQRDLLGIAPLHLCVFFSRHAVEDAVSLLVEQGANPNAAMNSTLEWGEHDITLQGAPMEWAVRCRHSQLVQALLHTAADVRGLNTAIELFFWEIADLLLLQKAWNDEEPPQLALSPIERPYRHWIAHGKDHLHTVSWTLDILEKHGLDFDRHFEELGGSTLLMVTISGSQTIDDFEIVRQLAKRGKNVKFANGYGFTALGNVMLRSGNKESWTETLQHLLTYYDTSELEQNYLFEGSYLHSAVSSDSVVGARELLRKGVDVNQPTYDSLQNTPLQICVLQDGSPEMMTLLLQHGANIEPSGGDLILSPLENRLLGLQTTSHLLDLLLEHRSSEQSCLHALHVALNNALICLDDTRKDAQEVFRHMIAKPAVQSFISDANPGEATLLHRAVAALNPYFTKLLLEAGADVMVSANIAGEDLVPLQVALGNGKFCWETHASMSQSTTVLCEQYERSRRAAFETTCLLLSEHTALENGGFEGITPLHLAAYMGIAVVVERLTATPGIDKEAKGSWPGQEGLLTPVQLLAATLIQDAFGYPFVGLFWHVNEQLQSLPSANRKYVPRQRTEGHNLYFHDLKDVQIKTGGGSEARFLLPPTLIYSPRLIYNNASQVAGLLGYKLSPSV